MIEDSPSFLEPRLRCQTPSTRSPRSPSDGETIDYYSLPALEAQFPDVAALPFSLKILLENLLRREDDAFVKADDIRALAGWSAATSAAEGNLVHAGARAAAGLHRRAVRRRSGGDARRHRSRSAAIRRRSIRCSRWSSSSITRCRSITSARPNAFALNADLEYHRNRERYVFLRWGQTAFRNFRVVPPETGIVHQVNIEYLARVVCREPRNGRSLAYPDTVFGTDSHTTMVNGLGVVGLGRRRHRSGSRDARPAELDADSAGRGLSADRPAAGRRDRHRSRADHHRGAAQEGRRRQRSSSSTDRAWRT